MIQFRLAVLLSLLAGGLFAQDPPKDDAPKKPDPVVKEKIKELQGLVRQAGRQDSAAVGVIQDLVDRSRNGVDSDKKLVAGALEKLFTLKRDPNQVTLFTAATDGLAALGTHGSRGLFKAVENRNFRKKEWLSLRAELIRALGRTKDPAMVKEILDLTKDKDDQVIAAAVDAARNYEDAEEKVRKQIVEILVRLFSDTTNGASSTDPGDMVAQMFKERFAMIAGPCNNTLSALTGQKHSVALEWLKWWNDNKNKKWDVEKAEEETEDDK